MLTLKKHAKGPYWPEPVRVFAKDAATLEATCVVGCGEATHKHYELILPSDAWAQMQVTEWQPNFSAKASDYRLAMEGERLRLAHSYDPLLATNNSAVDLLPHQLEAVYDAMLPQPVIRHMVAHDAGAGKTIICGLLHKELRMRQPNLRTLIVAPAALVAQWQREMADKFFERFEVIDRDALRRDPEVWTKTQQAITSVSFASQYEIAATLAAVPWDLVVVDEAHHLAAYHTHQTQAYALGSILSRRAKHLVLATATPHKGDETNFLKLVQLLDDGVTDPSVVRPGNGDEPGTPLMLRRLKEEMVDFDRQPLFLPRKVETRWHRLADDSPLEWSLYSALTDYVDKTYRAAEKVGGQTRVNVQFAMTILQRRMASSLAALESSLRRRRDALASTTGSTSEKSMDGLEDAPESERWEEEFRAETASPARTALAREREAAEIDALLKTIAEVQEQGPEMKVRKLQEVMAHAGVEPGNGERLLIFTEFLDTLMFLRRLFEEWGYTVTQIDGSMPQRERLKAEKDFSERCQVMVATEAAGEGINLQFCARMVNFDLPWVPTRLEQRMGRIHRYGQQREARIYNLGAGDTREGHVLRGLLERLDTMRKHLGDQVFDVISVLVADVDMEALMAQVVISPPEEGSQLEALEKLVQATVQGEKRYQQAEASRSPLNPRAYDDIQQASRLHRLTPEYAQHFVVDVLRTLGEDPDSRPSAGHDPGDSPLFQVTAHGVAAAECLGVRQGATALLTFDRDTARTTPGAQLLALGSPALDRFLSLAQDRWSDDLPQGAVFLDARLPPGGGYLMWHLRGRVMDGQGETVTERLFAVRQNADTIESAPTAALIDLLPTESRTELPPWMAALSHDPSVAWEWSLGHQMLPWLRHETECRGRVVARTRATLLVAAERAFDIANQAYLDVAFDTSLDGDELYARVQEAQHRVDALSAQLAREEACALTWPEVVGVAAVLPVSDSPTQEFVDLRPEVADAAMAAAVQYERDHGRKVVDVTGEHDIYPYDLYSTGPGGLRCIEVKGTTTGRIFVSENEWRAAQRLRTSFFLYIVTDPLGDAQVRVVRDPFAHLDPDVVLSSGVKYGFDAATWRVAVDEGGS